MFHENGQVSLAGFCPGLTYGKMFIRADDTTTPTLGLWKKTSQTANVLNVWSDDASTVETGIDSSSRLYFSSGLTQTTVGSAGGASALPATPTGYIKVNVNGTQKKVPYYDN